MFRKLVLLMMMGLLTLLIGSVLQADTDSEELPSIIFVKQTPVNHTGGTIADIFTNIEGEDPREDQPLGGGLFRLDPDGTLTNLTERFGNVAVRDPEISFDATRVIFSMKTTPTGTWDIYEMAVDGSESRRVTNNPANNWDPAYLSDGRIIYLSDILDLLARRNENLPAGHLSEGRIHIMNEDGSNSRPININPNGSFNPLLSQSGQIIFTQWDLRDLRPSPNDPPDGESYSRFLLWEMMSDGSREGHPIFGAHLVEEFGGGFMEVRELMDGSGDMIATLTQSLNTFGAGAIVRFTPRGAQDAQSYDFLTDSSGYTSSFANLGGRYRSAYPLPDGRIIASFADGSVYNGYGVPDFDLVILDAEGRHQVIYGDTDFWDWQAVAIVERDAPPMVEPTIYMDDVNYAIVNAMDVELRNRNSDSVANGDFQPIIEQGTAAFVRIFNLTRPPAPYSGGNPDDQDAGARLLGEVPVQEDGSFAAIVPARGMILFDVVDANGNRLVTERVWQEFAPGEIRTCGGCHTPDEGGGRTSNIALNNPVNLTTVDVDTDDNGQVDLLEAYYEAIGQGQ